MGRRELFDSAVDRHGVVAARHLGPSTMAPSTFHDWRQREEFERPHHGVTLLPGFPATAEQRLAAAVAGIGDRCAVTGWSAAYLYGLRASAPSTTDLLAPHGVSHRHHSGVRVVETTVFDDEEVGRVDGIPVVSGARMLADLARDAHLSTLTELAIDLRRKGRLGASDIEREIAKRRRFPGRGRLRALADQLREDDSDSGFEHRTRDRLTRRGTPPDNGQLEVVVAGRRRRIDLPYASAGVGVECIGLAFHGRDAFDRDADRRNDFAEDGRWRLLELTWTTFLLDWERFCTRLDRLLGRRGAA